MAERLVRKEEIKRYFFWAFILVLLILSFLVLRPFLIALVSAFILAYLVRPLFVRLEKNSGKSLAALVSVFIVVIVLVLPFGLLIGGISKQAYSYLRENSLDSILERVSNFLALGETGADLSGLTDRAVEIIASLLTSFVSFVPSFVIALFITLFGMYYILVDWDALAQSLKRYIPFEDRESVSREISRVTNAMVYGTLLIALIEFVAAALGFYLSGVNFFLILAVIVFFFAFIPGLGPAVVWVPLGVYYLAVGNIFTAIGVIITGVVLSFLIDVLLKSRILGRKTGLNPVLMLVGILGGIAVFGVFGFIIGPLVLLYTLKFLEEAVKHY